MVESSPEAALAERRIDARRNYEHIVDVAAEVLADDPAATLQDIAQAVGLHRATLHRHFRSREDLMDALRRRASKRLLAGLDEVERAQLSPGQAVEAFVRQVMAGAAEEPLWRFGTYYGAGSDEYRAEVGVRVTALLAGGQRAGILRTDLSAERLASVWSGVGYAMLPLLHEGEIDLDEAVAVVLLTLRAPGRARPPA